MKQKLILIISVVIGMLAALFTKQYLNVKDREVAKVIDNLRKSQRMINIVVVKRDLPAGTVLQNTDLGVNSVPESGVRGHAILSEDAQFLFGRKTMRLLERLDPVYWNDLEGGAPGSRGMADDIPNQMRAISINVSGSASVSGMVRPNDRVDVLGTFSFPSARNPLELELVTLTVLQNVTILATGRETAKTFSATSRSGSYSTVTLSVTPREAEMLVFAEQIKGRLVLALRNTSDVAVENDPPRVNFDHIQDAIKKLNIARQELLRKRTN
jgi:pilus assembly protein CpaB